MLKYPNDTENLYILCLHYADSVEVEVFVTIVILQLS